MKRRIIILVVGAAVLVSLAPRAQAPAPPPGLLIANAELIDGTAAPGRRADVRIVGDAIAEIGASLRPRPGERVIDAGGKVLAPGFIDTHSHADRGVDQMPDASTQVMQGITTAVVGQDGGGELPVSDFIESIERLHPAINYATTVGHGRVRGLVLGGDYKRSATPAENDVMKALVERAMKDGALGLSSGLEYDPGYYATSDEVVELAKVVARYGGYYTSHVRDEENEVLAAWAEAIDIGRKAGVPVLISHIKMAAKPVWGRTADAFKLFAEANRFGTKVMADWYPYTYWQSSIYVLIPDRDFDNRKKWEVGLDEIGGAQNVLVTGYRPNPDWNGKTIAELAQAQGKDPVTTIVDMVHAAGPNIGIIGTAMDEADLTKFAASPYTVICSDGTLSGRHPRGYGAFPRVLAKYVRDEHALTLAEAVAKMTGRSAAFVGLKDRGTIAVGRKADLVIFDPATIQDRGTPQQPSTPPVGISYVIVNGQVVLDDGRMTDARPGRALRRPDRASNGSASR